MNSQQEIPEQPDSLLPTNADKKKKVNRSCAICGDKAENWYYGVIACEACKVNTGDSLFLLKLAFLDL